MEIPWKIFVRQSECIDNEVIKQNKHILNFQGNEAKAAYEEIVKQEYSSNSTEKRKQNIMDSYLQETLKHLEQVEEKAHEILTDRQEIIAIDKKRNDSRMGMRALQKEKSNKTWLAVGPLLIKMPTKKAEELLIQDQKECDIEINKLRSNLKIKVNELRDLELIKPVPGLMLQPMTQNEIFAIKRT